MKDTFLAAIERHESLANSYGDLSDERSQALDYYLGKPLGNEIEGRSGVVSRDVFDTIEWIKPQLADIFCSGDQVVLFSPTGPNDVERAEQETEYVNQIATEKNEWFTIWNGWSHDAMLQKVGYVLAYHDDREDRTKEDYSGLSDDELTLLIQQNPEVQITKHEVETGPDGTPLHSVTLEQVKSYGCTKIENIAPERVLVSHNARGLNLQDPRLDFCEYWEYKTISELRDEGFKVEDNLSDHSDGAGDWEDESRDDLNPFKNSDGTESSPAARRLKVRNVWIRYDKDGDGLTELRRAVVVGTTILEDEECDMVTLIALCPVPLPHQHAGLSIADCVNDLQLIKTALLRGSLDNIYLANNGRHAVDMNRVNLDDMLVSRPGGVVRVDGPLGDAIMPLTHSVTGDVAVPMMEYVDRIAQKRTGVNEQSQGLDPNTLNKTATGAQMLMSAAQQRIKFIARIFAETGVKALFRVVHALTLKNARKQEIVRLRNQWVPVDPRQWTKRDDLSITVGLGSGDRAQQITMLNQILQIQAMAAQYGLAGPPQVYNTLKRLTQAAGYKDATEFWTDPTQNPPPPPGPPPEVLKEQAKAQAQAQIEQMKIQAEGEAQMRDHQLKMAELQANLQLQQSNDMRDAEREQLRAQMQAALDAQKIELDRWKADLDAQVTKYKTDQDNATKLQIAGMQAEQAKDSRELELAHDAAQRDEDRKVAKKEPTK